ncbi:hypothetical protein MRX96_037985 [Rhipicephalus microplus]
MKTLLRGIPGVIPYFDDVLIAGASGQELLSRLREVLRRFQDAGLKVKREKCQLGVAQVEFLGFRIDAEGIHPTPEKTQAILGAPRPSNKTELQAFLGLVTSAPFHPSTNGQAERMVRTTKEGLSRIIQGNWARRLADFTLQQHVTPHTTTGRSPAELLMGRKLSTMLDRLHPDRAPEKSTRLADSLSKPRTFQPEDPVFARNYAQGPLWIPAVISRATGPISYEVTAPDGRVLRRHVDQLRRRTVGPTQTVSAELERPQPERRPMSTSTPEGSSSVPVAPEGSSSAPVEPDAPGE